MMPTQCGCKLEKHSENYKVEEMIFGLIKTVYYICQCFKYNKNEIELFLGILPPLGG